MSKSEKVFKKLKISFRTTTVITQKTTTMPLSQPGCLQSSENISTLTIERTGISKQVTSLCMVEYWKLL